jgi:beta-xylosidase
MLQRVMADGVTPDGYPVQILDRSTVDGPLVEAPAIIDTHAGTYYLLYSSGCTTSPTYDVRYAIADNISGPYKRVAEPLLSTGDWSLEAPGSVGAFKNGKGGWNMAFHARE